MSFNFNLVVNQVSFGHLCWSILHELYKQNIEANLFLRDNQQDFSAYKNSPEFVSYVQTCLNRAALEYKKSDPALSLWHIPGSEQRYTKNQTLFTFYELDSPTKLEVNILNNQDKIIVSTNESKQILENAGVETPITYIPIGFDDIHFNRINKKVYKNEKLVVWMIAGKFEHRKRTSKAINTWVKKYGNNPNHILHLMVYNAHLKPEVNNQLLAEAFEGKRYGNVVPYAYMKTLEEVNETYNAANIVIDMAGAECWSMPSFHMVGLGKHAVIHNNTAFREWATPENAVLVESCAKIPAVDGKHFFANAPVNNGNIYDFNVDELVAGMEAALARFHKDPINHAGLKLKEKFTWAKSVSQILEVMKS